MKYCALVFLCMAALCAHGGETVVLRVYYAHPTNIARLVSSYDVLESQNRSERYLPVLAGSTTQARLGREGWRFTVDATASAGLGTPGMFGRAKRGDRTAFPLAFYGGYKTVAEITTSEVALRFLRWLVENHGTDADATWLVDWQETWIVPTVNPEGHWLVELGTQYPYTLPPNNGYTPQQATDLYPTSGDSCDFAYGDLGIPAFTFEMGNNFMPSYADIDTIQWPTNRPALIYAAKIARTPYQTVRGPDALNLSFVSTPSTIVMLTATIDERNNGS